ncbi:Fe-S cluster assembly protein SufD [Sneathiella limimaris]|uniref:Fe-S cluster assembly protein SufD n=1 Tax=Sneathiella limimaris TaxID=1964213 RepID=UPI00146F57C0|nr:Fe-S cluster assembly protein SufD [Sneathiella limimaris]
MKTLSPLAQKYVDRFETALETLPGAGNRHIETLRKSGLKRFEGTDFPNKRIEDWRFTNLSEFSKKFGEVANDGTSPLSNADFHTELEVVFIDGVFSAEHSKLSNLPDGVRLSSFAEDLQKDMALSLPEDENRSLYLLNTAFMQDGYCLYVEDETQVDTPLVIRFLNNNGTEGRHLRNRILMGKDSSLTLFEIHEGTGSYFSNPVTTVMLGEGAELSHYKLQNESTDAYHLALTDAELTTGSTYSNFSLSFGSKLSRNEFHTRIIGADVCSELNGAYLIGGQQHCDTTTLTEHLVPQNESKQIYKGVLDGKAHGVFQGKIHIHEDAQKVSGDQLSKALLLSDTSQVSVKPELEIYADDVKCSHGATSGELDEDALFYLMARGIDPDTARQMLIEAFLGDVLEEIQHPEIKTYFTQLAANWLSGNRGE